MGNKGLDYIKIENRGKVSRERLAKTEELMKKVTYQLDRGRFQNLCPKMYMVLTKEELESNESIGFQVTLFFDIFKGHVHIKKQKGVDLYNIDFLKRYPAEGKFMYKLSKQIKDVPFQDLFNQFKFMIEGENQKLRTGNVYLLKNGLVAILVKYYSNDKLGIKYDEYAEDIEEFITIEDIDSLIREASSKENNSENESRLK